MCRLLVNGSNALSELRIRIEHGDYLALACNEFNLLKKPLGPNGEDNGYFDRRPVRWQQVASEHLGEEAEAGKREQVRLQTDSSMVMKWTEIIDQAFSQILGYEARFIGYQVLAYADRTNVCYNVI